MPECWLQSAKLGLPRSERLMDQVLEPPYSAAMPGEGANQSVAMTAPRRAMRQTSVLDREMTRGSVREPRPLAR